MSEEEAIEAVLADFVPVGEDHPIAQETKQAVADMLTQRAAIPMVMPESVELESLGYDSGTVLRPGDVLVVSVAGQITQGQATQIKERLQAEMPRLARVVVMVGGVHVEAVYRDMDEEEH